MAATPISISIIFILITLLMVFVFYIASEKSKTAIAIILFWLLLQYILSIVGFYKVTDTFPPRFLLTLAPPLVLITILFLTTKGRDFIDQLNLKTLSLLHVIRIPVEVVLFLLFIHKAVPVVMTFEGRNFDIISGLTSPLVYYFVFKKRTWNYKLLLIWNFICLALLINIVIIAVLSAPFVFQQMAFEQPNIAILYFPFVWLPCCVVPLVFLSHFAAIRKLLSLK